MHAEICQFREGLKSFGFLDMAREYPSNLEALLCKGNKLSFVQWKAKMEIHFSPEGSHQRKEEEDAIYALHLFLLDCFAFSWSSPMVKLLITSWIENKDSFNSPSHKAYQIWQRIGGAMVKHGHDVTGERCDKKFRSSKHRYKMIVDKNNQSGAGGCCLKQHIEKYPLKTI